MRTRKRSWMTLTVLLLVMVGSAPVAMAQTPNPYEPRFHGQCTWWAAEMRPDLRFNTGNASSWASVSADHGYTVDDTPEVGAIAVWGPSVDGAYPAGHVAYVTSVTDATHFHVSEYNWGGGALAYGERDVTWVTGIQFIHTAGYNQPGAVTPTPPPVPAPSVNYVYSFSPATASSGEQVQVTAGAADVAGYRTVNGIEVEANGNRIETVSGNGGSVTWDTGGLPPGTYTVRFRALLSQWTGDVNAYESTYALQPAVTGTATPPAPSPTPPAPSPTPPARTTAISSGAGRCSATAIDDYLRSKSSPFAGQGQEFVSAGQQYNVDPRFVVAISNAESTFGTNGSCATQRHNAWGYGGGWPNCWNFDSWSAGIWQVTRDIGNNYFGRYHQTTIPLFVKSPAGTCTSHCWCASACTHWVQNVGQAYADLGGDPQTTGLSLAACSGGPGVTITPTPTPGPTVVVTVSPTPGATPSRPVLSGPANGATLAQNADVTLSWNAAPSATQYKVELWGGAYSLMTPCDWQSTTACHIGQMWPGTVSWHVVARNASGQESGWSDTWTFTIQESIATPTPTPVPPTATPIPPTLTSPPASAGRPLLSSPANGSSMLPSADVTLSWNAAPNATQYKVELWGGSYSLMTPCDWQSGTSCHIGRMWPGTMSWHVRARNAGGQESDWSDTWTFTIQESVATPTPVPPTSTPVPPTPTLPPASAGRPMLSSPANGSSLPQSTDVTLAWNPSPNAAQYKVELWGGPYSLMAPCNWQSGTSCHVGQMWPGAMSWHVIARNASGQESDWSDTWAFTIQEPPATPTPVPPTPTPTAIPPGPGNAQLIEGLAISPNNPRVGQSVNARFRVRNNGGQTFYARYFGAKGRDANDRDYSFFWFENFALAPGQEFTYDTNRTFDHAGNFWFTPNYSPDGSDWTDAKWPNGTTNYVTINVSQ